MILQSNFTVRGGPLGNDDTYSLAQAHAHWPSEHHVNDQETAAEIHLVHTNDKYEKSHDAAKHPDGLAVIGVFFDARSVPLDWCRPCDPDGHEAKPNPVLAHIASQLSEVTLRGDEVEMREPVDWARLLPDNIGDYYYYAGSLTTPPCSEVVSWLVMRQGLRCADVDVERMHGMHFVSKVELPKMLEAGRDSELKLDHNNRPVQPTNMRQVFASFRSA